MRRWVPGTDQITAIDDDGVVLFEWAAILTHLAKKAGQLIPADPGGEAKLVRWCFAAMNTFELPLLTLLLPGFVTKKDEPPAYPEFTDGWAKRRFADLDRCLEGRAFIASEAFTAAAIVMAHALDEIKDPSLLERCGRARVEAGRDGIDGRACERRPLAEGRGSRSRRLPSGHAPMLQTCQAWRVSQRWADDPLRQ